MAHFARLDENNIVTMVTVVSNADMVDANGNEVESLGISVCEQVVGPGPWVQTSYNGKSRGRYAGIGMKYYPEFDAFAHPKPEDGNDYIWDAESLSWVSASTPEPEPQGE